MTDLEKHVNQPGRAKLVKDVRAKIKELGITYEDVILKFIGLGLLPKNYLSLK